MEISDVKTIGYDMFSVRIPGCGSTETGYESYKFRVCAVQNPGTSVQIPGRDDFGASAYKFRVEPGPDRGSGGTAVQIPGRTGARPGRTTVRIPGWDDRRRGQKKRLTQ